MAVKKPELKVERPEPSGVAVDRARKKLPDGVPAINELDGDARLDYPRNIDAATVWELQIAIEKDQKIAYVSGRSTEQQRTKSQTVGGEDYSHTRFNTDLQGETFRVDRGVVGVDSSPKSPTTVKEARDTVFDQAGNANGCVIDLLVRVHDEPFVTRHCKGDPELVYEILVKQGNSMGSHASHTGQRFASITSLAREELIDAGYDPDIPEDQNVLGRMKGALSTVGVLSSAGETHVDMARRGTVGDVIRSMAPRRTICRDIASPRRMGSDPLVGECVGYQAERWAAPVLP